MSKLFGERLWGVELWGGLEAPPLPPLSPNDYYRILFYSPAGDKIAEVSSKTGQNIVNSFDFELNKTGCGSFSITLTRDEIDLRVGDLVEIYLISELFPWYTGYIQQTPETGRTDKIFKYSGYGLVAKLDEIIINTTYAAIETSVIITTILENEIIPKKPEIIENTTKIEVTTFTPTASDFTLTKAKKAISDLVTQAGNYAAGVDEKKEFFFKARLTTIQQAAVKAISKHLEQFNPSQNNSGIINKIYLKTGQAVAGSNYVATINDLTSQTDYGIREDVATLPTTDNSVDALQWGAQLLAEKKDPVITATITGIDILKLREKIKAEGKARILLLKE